MSQTDREEGVLIQSFRASACRIIDERRRTSLALLLLVSALCELIGPPIVLRLLDGAGLLYTPLLHQEDVAGPLEGLIIIPTAFTFDAGYYATAIILISILKRRSYIRYILFFPFYELAIWSIRIATSVLIVFSTG